MNKIGVQTDEVIQVTFSTQTKKQKTKERMVQTK